MTEGIIRRAKQNDLTRLIELLNQLSPPKDNGFTENSDSVLAKIILDDNYYLNVYDFCGELEGTSMLFVQYNLSHGCRPVGHVENVVVDERFRGQGIGRILVNDLIRVARNRQCYKLILNCTEHNVPFYQFAGFRRTGEIELRNEIQ